MGLGGYLMWTAVGKELSSRTGLKVLPIESHGSAIKLVNSPIFYNNKSFVQPGEIFDVVIPIILNDPNTNYCKKDTPEKAVHRHDKHIIAQICEQYGISSPNLKCEIFLTEQENIYINDFLLSMGSKDYITVEPHTKDEYTVNKTYPFKKWQNIVDEISKHITVVQIGQKTDKILEGCINATGSSTFREAAAIISESCLFIGPEGGLMHAANAVGIESVIVITGFIHPRMTCYPENTNIWIGKSHGPCGLKILCDICKKECDEHSPDIIIESIKQRIGI
jgi:ADP-heptose:LPS heptosyltransferase